MKYQNLGLPFTIKTIVRKTTAISAAILSSAAITAAASPDVLPGCPSNCPPPPPPPLYVNLSTCACATTAQFVAAAQQKMKTVGKAGTYVLTSTSTASTAIWPSTL